MIPIDQGPIPFSKPFSLEEIEPIEHRSFQEIFDEQQGKNLPFVVAFVQDQSINKRVYPFSGASISTYLKTYSKNPLTRNPIDKIYWYVVSNFFSPNLRYIATTSGSLSNLIENLVTYSNQQDADAGFILGILFMFGIWVLQSYEEALKWFRLASENGDAFAQNALGDCYYEGYGVTQCYEEALKWYQLAAAQGNDKAQFSLGFIYECGQGVKQCYEEAVKWYLLAAAQGNSSAQNNLGVCYYNGHGVKKSDKKVAKWFRLAASHGNTAAQTNLGVLL